MPEQSRFVGYIDAFTGQCLEGWIIDTKRPEGQPAVFLELDGETIATMRADVERSDLRGAGYKTTAHGFHFDLEPALPLDAWLDVRIGEDGPYIEWLLPRPYVAPPPTSDQVSAAVPTPMPGWRREALLTLALHGPEVLQTLAVWAAGQQSQNDADGSTHAMLMHLATTPGAASGLRCGDAKRAAETPGIRPHPA